MNEIALVIGEEIEEESKKLATCPIELIPKINLVPHTIFLLCGPTYSGKSTFAEDLECLASYHGLSYETISSDKNREVLLRQSKLNPYGNKRGENRYSEAMDSVSGPAFDLLMCQLKIAVTYPVNTEIVIVDTTAMNEVFRNEILAIARAAGYLIQLVTFEYKFKSDYYRSNNLSKSSEEKVFNSVTRFRQKVLPSLNTKSFDGRLRIKSRLQFGWDIPREDDWWDDLSQVTWVDNAITEEAKEALIIQDRTEGFTNSENRKPKTSDKDINQELLDLASSGGTICGVIGDSHECVEELKELVEGLTKKYPLIRLVHVGDYLDKGGNTKEMIEYMYSRMKAGDIIVQGNHETYIYRRLLGEETPKPEVEKDYFTSLETLLNNEELAKTFEIIYEASVPFVVLFENNPNGNLPVIVTHAPCENKYLGKVNFSALRAQRNYRAKDKTQPIQDELHWLYEEANNSLPLHIFGHIAHHGGPSLNHIKWKNKIFLDTGVVYGGSLTAVVLQQGKIIDQISVTAKKIRSVSDLPAALGFRISKEKVFNIDDYNLESRERLLLKRIEQNGVRYISGTMSPSPSKGDKLEPLDSAFDMFKAAGVNTVNLQPKFMGSRAQLYLFKDGPEKTFMTSRAGWKIKTLTGITDEKYSEFLTQLWKDYKRKFGDSFDDMIIDGELMPWHALGEGLISNNFLPYQKLIEEELNVLTDDEGFKELTEFYEKFDLIGKKKHLEKFKEVLDIFGKAEDPWFEGFDVLYSKAIEEKEGKNVRNEPTVIRYQMAKSQYVDDLGQGIVDLNDESSVRLAHEFFNTLTTFRKMEGVVVKPYSLKDCDIPYVKVRSDEYLRLVYGYDYLSEKKYQKLIRQKTTRAKLKLSISEAKLGEIMLVSEGDARKEAAVKLIAEMKQEAVLDPRL